MMDQIHIVNFQNHTLIGNINIITFLHHDNVFVLYLT